MPDAGNFNLYAVLGRQIRGCDTACVTGGELLGPRLQALRV